MQPTNGAAGTEDADDTLAAMDPAAATATAATAAAVAAAAADSAGVGAATAVGGGGGAGVGGGVDGVDGVGGDGGGRAAARVPLSGVGVTEAKAAAKAPLTQEEVVVIERGLRTMGMDPLNVGKGDEGGGGGQGEGGGIGEGSS